jgi:hypothetical protein
VERMQAGGGGAIPWDTGGAEAVAIDLGPTNEQESAGSVTWHQAGASELGRFRLICQENMLLLRDAAHPPRAPFDQSTQSLDLLHTRCRVAVLESQCVG